MKILYILDENGEPKHEPEVLRWAAWFETSMDQRIVARDELPSGLVVSSVFLGIDHNHGAIGPAAEQMPVLWETMLFRPGKGWNAAVRHSSRADALEHHRWTVAGLLQRWVARQ